VTNYIVDASTGAKVVHYTGHFGKLKALKTLVSSLGIDHCLLNDYYNLNVAHYAARSGELEVLKYLQKVN
jgi:hypothetical protein